MSNPVDNNAQTRLLFKQFMGVASTELSKRFDSETFNFVPNIFSKDVMIEDIPSIPAFFCNVLDSSGSWLDSSSNYSINSVEESTYYDSVAGTYTTFSQMFPTSNLKFYKRLSLVPVTSGSYGRVWGSFTDYSGSTITNKNSVLEHAIPFKYDDIDGGYLPVVYRNGNASGSYSENQENLNSYPTYWLMDAGSGYLIFYAATTDLETLNIKDIIDSGTNIQDPLKAPKISCFVYSGKTGITNLDVSGQIQVGDISGLKVNMDHIDRMILPDGSANSLIDLCGNDAIRTQYEYVRKNLFIGYPTQPIIDISRVDHTQDPSFNNIFFELDISGNTLVRGNLNVLDHTQLVDVSATNLDLSGNLNVLGHMQLVDVSATNLDLSGKLNVLGHTQLIDVSATNLDLSGNLNVLGQSNFNNINAKTTINNKETYLLVKSEPSGPIRPTIDLTTNTPIVDYFNVAYFINSPVIVETKNVAAYFVFTNNRSSSENKQCIHFIAGANRNQNGDISGGYIKVLSNYVDIASNTYVALTEIAIATNAPYTNLILGFSTNAVGSQISDCELRMYKNTYGLQEDTGPSWIMGKNVPVTNGLFNNKLISPDDYPGTLWSKIIEIHIDPLTCPNAYSTLNETFLGDVDICGNFNMSGTGTIGNLVLGDLEVTGNTLLRGTLDVCGNTTLENTTVNEYLTVAKIIFTKDISAGNYIYSNGYRGNSNRTNAPLILDASYNDFCSFNIKHQRGDISIGKKSEQTGWTIQSEDGIHMLTDSTRMNPISVTEKTLDMSDNDIINIRTLGVQDISVNELSGNNIYSHGSLLLDYSSVEITTASNSGNWYDIAFVGNETIGISDISKTYLGSSASAVIEIYVIEKLETDHTRLSNGFSYVKCNVELFREQSASIEVITGFNMAASKKIIQSLRIKYGRQGAKSGYPLPPEPRGLFQIKLSEEDMSGNNGGNEPTLSLYCRITDNNFISYQTASGFEYPETTWRMHLGTIVNDSPTYFYQGNASPGLSTNYHTYETFREVECVFNPNVGTLTSNGVAIEMNGRMYYINDKDSEFTSKCKFGEEVDFSNNILVRGNANINGTLSASQYVGGIYCDGSDISNVNRINCNYCDISYGLVVGDGHSGAALDISNTSLTRLKFRGYKMSSSPINTLVATVNTTIGTATSYNNKLYFTVNPENSPDVAFVVKTPNNDTAFVIGNTNNIECNVGLSLYRDTVVNVDAGLVTNSMGIMNDVGYNVDTAKMMDALVWKPNIPGSTDTKVLVNEMVSHIYNRQLTGSTLYGGIKPGNSSTVTLGSTPNTYQYQKYVEAQGPTRHSYFGFNPTSNDGISSSRPISSKSHFLRDTWITGLYMNTPWCDQGSPAGTLFTWGVTPTASYVDIEIGYSNNYTQVYRIGNDPSANAMYFPSSTGYNTSSGGVRIDLEAKDWIYVEAGTNQATVIRFKYFMGSGGEIYILDEKDSTNYHHSEIDGYVTYVQHPRAI